MFLFKFFFTNLLFLTWLKKIEGLGRETQRWQACHGHANTTVEGSNSEQHICRWQRKVYMGCCWQRVHGNVQCKTEKVYHGNFPSLRDDVELWVHHESMRNFYDNPLFLEIRVNSFFKCFFVNVFLSVVTNLSSVWKYFLRLNFLLK